MQNTFEDTKRETINIGSWPRCCKNIKVDAEDYFRSKLDKVQSEWDYLKIQ